MAPSMPRLICIRLAGIRTGICMPVVFGGAEYDPVYRAGKEAFLPGFRTVETHLHRMVMVSIFVDQHDGPLPIGTLHRIRRHERIPVAILYVARALEQLVYRIHRLHPFFCDDFRRKILRRIVKHAPISVHRQKAVSSVNRSDVVKVISAARACGQHRTHVIRQPEPAFHGLRSAILQIVSFRHIKRHILRAGRYLSTPESDD